MYATCLFCNAPLGRNEVLEHFPVGRRLAYDGAKGRLWVVCTGCERWNLTPLETRWEAIEEAERAFRATRLRVSTDNIGLAQLNEGLELVRIGAPPQLEFAAWRYGDQFGRRRRKYLLIAAGGIAGGLVPGILNFAGAAGVGAFGWGATTAMAFASTGASLTSTIILRRSVRRSKTATVIVVKDERNAILRMTNENILMAAFVPDGSPNGWRLKIPHRIVPAVGHGDDAKQAPEAFTRYAWLTGVTAQRALSQMLPHVNRDGGSDRRVRDATKLIAESSTLEHLLRTASTSAKGSKTLSQSNERNAWLCRLPGPVRLALEMALHDDDERRAMEGELAELERRWRAAEVIANIADSLTLPEEIERRVDDLRTRGDGDA